MSDTAKAGIYAEKHYRVRLSEEDCDLLVSALRQQLASKLSAGRKDKIRAMIDRLIERRPGRH